MEKININHSIISEEKDENASDRSNAADSPSKT
jgi:hypothetical protein